MAKESRGNKLIDRRPSLYTREQAEHIADELTRSDGEWEFRAVHFDYGSYVMAYDERDEFVGYWSDPEQPKVNIFPGTGDLTAKEVVVSPEWPAEERGRVNPCTKCNRSWHADSNTNCAEMCEELRAYRASFYSRDAFEKIRREFEQYEGNLLGVKRQDYTARGDEDCLENFRQIASFEGRSMPEVCLSQVIKHIQAIHRAVSTGRYSFSWEQTGGEGLRSRIADARNLLLLLAACLDHAEEGRGGQVEWK